MCGHALVKKVFSLSDFLLLRNWRVFGGVSAERTLFSRLDLGGVERIKTGDWGVFFLFVSASWDMAVGMCAFSPSRAGESFFFSLDHSLRERRGWDVGWSPRRFISWKEGNEVGAPQQSSEFFQFTSLLSSPLRRRHTSRGDRRKIELGRLLGLDIHASAVDARAPEQSQHREAPRHAHARPEHV